MTQKWQPIDEVHESVFNKHMRAIFNFMEEGTVILDRYKRIILINKSAQDFIGYTYDEIYQYPFEHLIDNKKHLNQIWEVVHSARKWQGEVTVRTKKNLFVSYRLVLREIRNEQGDLINYYALLKDMTEYEQSRSKLRLAAKVIENTSEGVMVTNKDGEIMSVNPAFTKVTGYSQEEAIGNNPSFLQSGVHSKPFYEKMWKEIMETGSWNGEIWNRRKDGSLYPEWVNISAIYTNRDDVSNYVAVFSDITERKKAEERLKQLAHYDVLTGVANRYFFNTQLDKFIEQAKYNSNALAVLFLDLDRFKVINDTLGHDIGDELLKGVANRMKKCLPKEAFIARLGGDEFTVLLPKVEDRTEASKSATCIIDAFKKPFNFEGHEVYVTTSIGISLFPQDGEDGEQLVKHSDMAMYEAKSRARNTYTYYREDLDSSKLEMVELENHLRKALDREEFSVEFQPQVDLQSGKVVGVESLLRWNHPSLGNVPPYSFVPLAEETGMIMAISDWVVKKSCSKVKQLHDQGYPIRCSVNVSAMQFQQDDFVGKIAAILNETKLDPRYLEIELTETMIMPQAAHSIDKLVKLKKLGVKISIDDFGTGYSSLSYLNRLPIDTLKIDKSFIRNLKTYHEDASIVTAIITMAHNLSLSVVAEGVELPKHIQFLKREKCDMIQGYFISKPVPFERLIVFLEDWMPDYLS